ADSIPEKSSACTLTETPPIASASSRYRAKQSTPPPSRWANGFPPSGRACRPMASVRTAANRVQQLQLPPPAESLFHSERERSVYGERRSTAVVQNVAQTRERGGVANQPASTCLFSSKPGIRQNRKLSSGF